MKLIIFISMSTSAQDIKHQLKASYGKIAKDFSDSRSQHWPEFEVFLNSIPDGSDVLDLGCGNGRLYAFLKEHISLDYTGIDFCPELLAIARERYPEVDFFEQDIAELDLDGRFDRIICIAAFHHLPGKKMRKQALKKIFDTLEDDGVLMISVWNLWQWKYWRQHLKAWIAGIFSAFRKDPRDLMIPFGKKKILRYYHAFLPFEIKRLLNSAGFYIEHFQVSRHNYLFVCSKRMLKAVSHPASVKDPLANSIRKPSPIATYKSHS